MAPQLKVEAVEPPFWRLVYFCLLAFVAGCVALPAVSPSASEIQLQIGAPDWPLPATLLTTGETDARCPLVVMLSGSGPNPSTSLEELGKRLAKRGVCSLRFKKRALQHATRVAETYPQGLTLDEQIVDDAVSAVVRVSMHPRVDAERVFVLGHSLGGLAIPRVAGRSDARGFIIMAGPSTPLEQALVRQLEHIVDLDEKRTDAELAMLARLRRAAENVESLNAGGALPATDLLTADLPNGLSARFWNDLTAQPLRHLLANELRPFLVLHAGRDYQVTQQDFEGWKRLLEDNPNAQFVSYPAANHIFTAGRGPGSPSEYRSPGPIIDELVDDIVAFVVACGRPSHPD